MSSIRVVTEKFRPFQQMVLTKKIIGDKCNCWQASMMTNAIDDICHRNLLSVATTYKFHKWQTSLVTNIINKSWHWKVPSISTNGTDEKDYWRQMLLMTSINDETFQKKLKIKLQFLPSLQQNEIGIYLEASKGKKND